jgi:hypothetical protein
MTSLWQHGSKVRSRCLRSETIFLKVHASEELLKNGGQFTTLSTVPAPSDHKSLEEFGLLQDAGKGLTLADRSLRNLGESIGDL